MLIRIIGYKKQSINNLKAQNKMKQKIKDLFRKVCNRLFFLLAKGIIEKNPDGSVHTYCNAFVEGDLTTTGNRTEKSQENLSQWSQPFAGCGWAVSDKKYIRTYKKEQ